MCEGPTQTWREQGDVQIGQKLLLICIELAKSRNDVSRQAHAYNLENGLKYQHT